MVVVDTLAHTHIHTRALTGGGGYPERTHVEVAGAMLRRVVGDGVVGGGVFFVMFCFAQRGVHIPRLELDVVRFNRTRRAHTFIHM